MSKTLTALVRNLVKPGDRITIDGKSYRVESVASNDTTITLTVLRPAWHFVAIGAGLALLVTAAVLWLL